MIHRITPGSIILDLDLYYAGQSSIFVIGLSTFFSCNMEISICVLDVGKMFMESLTPLFPLSGHYIFIVKVTLN